MYTIEFQLDTEDILNVCSELSDEQADHILDLIYHYVEGDCRSALERSLDEWVTKEADYILDEDDDEE